jgi:tRNA(fMet)-specific endonuclease VapC
LIVLDTSALSAVMHRDPGGLERIRKLDPASVVLCSPVAAEIRFGLARLDRDSRRHRVLASEYNAIRSVVRWMDWTEDAADIFGDVKASLQSLGQPLEDFDLAIASVALDLGAGVATRNARHFERIEGLTVEDWLD